MVFNIEVVMGKPAFLGSKKLVEKVLILLHKQTKWRFHLTVFVCVNKFSDEIMGSGPSSDSILRPYLMAGLIHSLIGHILYSSAQYNLIFEL